MTNLLEEAFAVASRLPEAEQNAIAQLILQQIAQKHTQPHPVQQRVLGLNQGEIWMSEDFNESLPDEFWTGEQ